MFVAKSLDRLYPNMVDIPVYTDGGKWYPQECNFLNLKHILHSPLEEFDRMSNAVF
ncbi:MAG TPA: hypothetical protein VFV86_02715 [Nitrososphaeraceae archaeon]|nr:hypothetical protein [Nitrososphaeraceae archaeon]